MGRLVEERRVLEDKIATEVRRGRAEGMTWLQVGVGLATSAQSAWERYGLTYKQQQERSALQAGALKSSQGVLDFVSPPSVQPDKSRVTGKRKSKKQPGQTGQ